MVRKKVISLFITILCLGVLLTIGVTFLYKGKASPEKKDPPSKQVFVPKEEPKVKVIDLDSDTRPIGLMISNEGLSWQHAGLQEAFLVYEIIVEGGETRLLAFFKDVEALMVGPIRSSRHYFLDYALENDAVYLHHGFSPQAERDIKALGINNINGTQADGHIFWREPPKNSYQNLFTDLQKVKKRIKEKNYRLTSQAEPLLDYAVESVKLSGDNAKEASDIRINYSWLHYVEYKYDPDSLSYKRYTRGIKHLDRNTNKQYTAKNIIVYQVNNYSLNDNSGKGRQGLNNIGKGNGYYITEGMAIPITWEKKSRASKTIYQDMDGNVLKVNDGNTFIHIQPVNQKLLIS
jgi:hypothetical protein